MHELSIAMSIANMALLHAKKENAKKIKEIELMVGKWAGVDTDSLLFSLNAVINNTKGMHGCKISIIKCEPLVLCKGCNIKFSPSVQYYEKCPICGCVNTELLKGRELSLSSIIVDK